MIQIDGLLFDIKSGEILLPERMAIPFRSSHSAGVGVQITSARGPEFTLTLTMFCEANEMGLKRIAVRERVGSVVRIVDYYRDLTIDYLRPENGAHKFVVTMARVVQARNVLAWQGYRFGTAYRFEPAARVVSQWTMHAIKV